MGGVGLCLSLRPSPFLLGSVVEMTHAMQQVIAYLFEEAKDGGQQREGVGLQ